MRLLALIIGALLLLLGLHWIGSGRPSLRGRADARQRAGRF
jgi:hypothetical protein